MNENFTTTELLIKHLDKELGTEENIALEKQLQDDVVLRNELDGLRLAQQSVRLYGLHQAVAGLHKEAMAGVTEQAATQPRITPVRRIVRYSAVAAAAALITIVSTVGYQYATVNSQELYNDIYTAYTPSRVRGAENNAVKLAYTANQFQQVVQLVQQATNPAVEEYYLAGNAYLQLHNAAGAIGSFTLAQQKNNAGHTSFYAEDIEYYLALAYLQNNQLQQALPLFTAIYHNNQHAYHDKISSWQLKRLRWLAEKK